MQNWYTNLYKAFLIGSVICFIIYMATTGQMSLGAMISGYSILLLSILMISYIVLYYTLKNSQKATFFQSILNMVFAFGPFLLTFFIISYVLYLVITYKNRILLGHVSSGYSTFSNIIIILLLLQIYIIYNNINSEKFETTKTLSKITSSLLYLYGVIAGICSLTLAVILSKFSADG